MWHTRKHSMQRVQECLGVPMSPGDMGCVSMRRVLITLVLCALCHLLGIVKYCSSPWKAGPSCEAGLVHLIPLLHVPSSGITRICQ